MKIRILLLILLALPFQLKAQDTTRAYCGTCIDLTGKDYDPNLFDDYMYKDGYWGLKFRGCELNILNCHYDCIDGDLYRICGEVNPGRVYIPVDKNDTLILISLPDTEDKDFIPGPTKIPSNIVQCGYCKLKYSMRVGHWDCPVLDAEDWDVTIVNDYPFETGDIVETLDTIRVCDTVKIADWLVRNEESYDDIFGDDRFQTITKMDIGYLIEYYKINCDDSTIQVCDTTWYDSPFMKVDSFTLGSYTLKNYKVSIICRDSLVRRE